MPPRPERGARAPRAGADRGRRARAGTRADRGRRARAGADQGEGNIQEPQAPRPAIRGLSPTRQYSHYLRVPTMREGDEVIDRWPQGYQSAINVFRTTVSSGNNFAGEENIFRLRLPNEGHEDDFTLVLYNSDGVWVIIFFRTQDMYLRGFKNKFGYFKFSDMEAAGRDIHWTDLRFKGTYVDLERKGGRDANGLSIGLMKLQETLLDLSNIRSPTDGDDESKATGLMMLVIAFAEAARFECIFQFFSRLTHENKCISANHVTYVKNWAKVSKCMIAGEARPDRIEIVNATIRDIRLSLFDEDRIAMSVEDLRLMIRLVSGQTEEDSVQSIIGEN